MLFKTDENIHQEIADLLRHQGHDALSVFDQGMRGYSDEEVAAVCQHEGRVLVTLDLDFSNILAFPPEDYAGIIILRLHDPSRPSVKTAIQRLMPLLNTEQLVGHLWTVDEAGIRIRPGEQSTE
jgi:predicted nuclease of predicted toxin-antitoxin system